MVVNGESLHGTAMQAVGGQVLGLLHVSEIETVGLDFAGSVLEWCELGFSICESYLIEAQNLFLEHDLGGFLSMAEAQLDDDLTGDALAHANALLAGVALRFLAGQLHLVESETAPDLNWQAVANLWRAMEVTQGDMRLPRLDSGFEGKLRAALRLS